MPHPILPLSFTALALSTCLTTNSFAFDATSYFQKWEDLIESKGNDVTIGSIIDHGPDGATLKQIIIQSKKDQGRLEIDELTVTGPTELGNSGFSYDTLDVKGLRFNRTENDKIGSVTIDAFSGTDFSLAGAQERKHPLWPMKLGSVQLSNLKMKIPGETGFELSLPTLSVKGLLPTTGNGFKLDALSFGEEIVGSYKDKSSSGNFAIGASSVKSLEYTGLSGVELDDISLGAIAIDGHTSENQAFTLSFDGGKAQNLYYPDIANTAPDRKLFSTDDLQVDLGAAQFSLDGNKVAGWQGIIGHSQYDEPANKITGSVKLSGVFFSFAALPDDPKNIQVKKQMAELGYDSITLDYGGDGIWDFGNGLMAMDSVFLNIKDVGDLNIAMKIGGYSEELLRGLLAISAKIQSEKDQQKIQATNMEMLGLYSQLNLVDAAISLTNNSLANRIIEMQSKKTGQKPEQMMASLPFIAGALLPQIGLQDYAQAATEAIGNLLKINGSVTVKIAPDQPVPFLEFMQIQAAVKGKQMTPADLAKRFNLEIKSK